MSHKKLGNHRDSMDPKTHLATQESGALKHEGVGYFKEVRAHKGL